LQKKEFDEMGELDHVEFVNNLDIDDPRLADFLAPTARSPSTFLCQAAVIALDEMVSDEGAADILDSYLLAQLVADRKTDRFTDSKEWLANVSEVLDQLGWTSGGFNSGTFQPTGQYFDTWEVVQSQIPVDGKIPASHSLNLAVTRLNKDNRGDILLEYLEENTHRGSAIRLVAVVMLPSVDEELSLVHCAVTINGGKVILRNFSDRLSLGFGDTADVFSEKLTLNKKAYEKIRETVREKLATVPREKLPVPIEGS
jgi:hypothetical protein